jgi:hypothetical protein
MLFQERHEIDERKAVERAAGKQIEIGSNVGIPLLAALLLEIQ